MHSLCNVLHSFTAPCLRPCQRTSCPCCPTVIAAGQLLALQKMAEEYEPRAAPHSEESVLVRRVYRGLGRQHVTIEHHWWRDGRIAPLQVTARSARQLLICSTMCSVFALFNSASMQQVFRHDRELSPIAALGGGCILLDAEAAPLMRAEAACRQVQLCTPSIVACDIWSPFCYALSSGEAATHRFQL